MRHFHRFLLVAVLVNLLELGSCRRWPVFKKIEALTFNTRLSGVVEIKNPGHETSRADRRAAIIDAIRVEDADIVCLQEVMIGKDVEAIVNGLLDIYPSSHSSLHLFNGILPSQSAIPVVPPCPNNQTTALLECTLANCMINLTGSLTKAGGIFDCVFASCMTIFQKVVLIGGEQCLGCIMNQIQDPSNIVPNCAPSTLTSRLGTMNTNGLLMLSKHRFTSRRTVDFYPNTLEVFVRGYLEAEVEDKVTAVCTHINPYVPGTNPEPFMRNFFNTSIEQNAYEIGQLISQFRDVKPAVVMGDFNVNGRPTPEGIGYGTPAPEGSGYDQFLRLTSVFNTDVSEKCSFCRSPENVYNVNDEPSDTVIDYVLGNGLWIFNTKALTFNTGLTGIVEIKNPGAETSQDERRTAIIKAIRCEDADIVCLQEVMTGKDIEAFLTGLQDIYPHSHSSLHLTDGTFPPQTYPPVVPPCPVGGTNAFLLCILPKLNGCLTGGITNSFGCVVANCTAQFLLVSKSGEKCLSCILNQILTPDKIIINCASSSSLRPLGTMNTNGLLMLSKRKFTSRRTVEFHPNIPEIFVRGYLEANIEDTITAICTHLIPYGTGINPEPFMQPLFPTTNLQNAYEIGQLISQFRDVKPAVLMGDFNVNGRSTPALTGYDQFLRLISAFNTKVSNKCSYCRYPENVYNVDTTSDRVIDFVFGNGVRIFNTKRVFTPDTVSIPDKGQSVPLSDHYGITGQFILKGKV